MSAADPSSPTPMPPGAYRAVLLRHMASPGRDPFRLVQFWFLVLAFLTLQWVVLRTPWWPLALACSVPLGLILVSFFALLHELMHGAVVKNRTVAWLHAWLAGFYSGITPDAWAREHNAHHANLGRPESDPDAVYDLDTWRRREGVRKGVRLMPGSRYWLGLLARPVWWMAVHAQLLFSWYLPSPEVSRGRKALAVAIWTLDVVAQVALVLGLGWRYALFGFLIPVIIQNLVLMYFLLGTHLTSPRTREKDPLWGSLSLHMGPLLGAAFLDAGRHVEHHLFPRTSHRKLREVSALLRREFPHRFNEVSFVQSALALERTGRIYVGDDVLWEPQRDTRSSTFSRHRGELRPPCPLTPTPADERQPLREVTVRPREG